MAISIAAGLWCWAGDAAIDRHPEYAGQGSAGCGQGGQLLNPGFTGRGRRQIATLGRACRRGRALIAFSSGVSCGLRSGGAGAGPHVAQPLDQKHVAFLLDGLLGLVPEAQYNQGSSSGHHHGPTGDGQQKPWLGPMAREWVDDERWFHRLQGGLPGAVTELHLDGFFGFKHPVEHLFGSQLPVGHGRRYAPCWIHQKSPPTALASTYRAWLGLTRPGGCGSRARASRP